VESPDATIVLLAIETAHHRYLVRRELIRGMRTVASTADLERPDERGRPVVGRELGPLLDATDQPQRARRHALLVPLRRRSVALLVERVAETIHCTDPAAELHPLPPLLARSLAHEWIDGVLLRDTQPVLVLNVWRIAQHVLRQTKQEPHSL
jgi:chemotaxis signal transduction protein